MSVDSREHRLLQTLMTAASRTLLLAALAALAVLLVPATGSSAKPPGCAKQIIADWFDDNRIDKIYKPLSCYRQAIQTLPADVKEYTNAADDIRRAWALARKGKEDTGRPTSGGDPTDGNGGGSGGGSGSGSGPGGGDGVGLTPGSPGGSGSPAGTPAAGNDPVSGGAVAAESASVPLPLIVVAGLAGLLLVLGGVGYITRRRGETIDAEAGSDAA